MRYFTAITVFVLAISAANFGAFWDGGAGTTSWNDAANWDPDGVPTTDTDISLGADPVQEIVVSDNASSNRIDLGYDNGKDVNLTVDGAVLTTGWFVNASKNVNSTVNITNGGTLDTVLNRLYVANSGTGVLNVYDGTVKNLNTVYGIFMCDKSSGNGTINLYGGEIIANGIEAGLYSGQWQINIGSGQLILNGDHRSFLNTYSDNFIPFDGMTDINVNYYSDTDKTVVSAEEVVQNDNLYWDGGAGTTSWNDSANWDPDGVPASDNDLSLGADSGQEIVISADAFSGRADLGYDNGKNVSLTVDGAAWTSGWVVNASKNVNSSINIINDGTLDTVQNRLYVASSGTGVINVYEGTVINSNPDYGIFMCDQPTGNGKINLFGGEIIANGIEAGSYPDQWRINIGSGKLTLNGDHRSFLNTYSDNFIPVQGMTDINVNYSPDTGKTVVSAERILQENYVLENPREIPVIAEKDVVVLGGSTGAVSAAVSASESGASVFLAAPKKFLGEDIYGSYRLWLEDGLEPNSLLAEKVFEEPEPFENMLDFDYTTDIPSAGGHKDTDPPSLLNDFKYANAVSQSVQYDGDVKITVDLGAIESFYKLNLKAYQRVNGFEVQDVTVFASSDQQQWQQIAYIENDMIGEGLTDFDTVDLEAQVNGQYRYLRFDVQKTDNVSRVLLAELQIIQEPEGGLQSGRRPPTPMQVKTVLNDALFDADVPYIVSSYPTEILKDASGNPAGVVITNRTGRQAIKAKVIIDATPRAAAARICGAQFRPFPQGNQQFKRYVVRGEEKTGPKLQSRVMPTPVSGLYSGNYDALEYQIEIFMPDNSYASFQEAEQTARELTYSIEQVDTSQGIWQIPQDPVLSSNQYSGEFSSIDDIPEESFKSVSTDRIYVLSGCADVSRTIAEELLYPPVYIALGERIGGAAALAASNISLPQDVEVKSNNKAASISAEVKESKYGARPTDFTASMVKSEARGLKVLAEYDVVVVGGGTSGAPAAIAALRGGADTLVVEAMHDLGGVSTLGLIGKYYYGNRVGFTEELDTGVAAMNAPQLSDNVHWNVEAKEEWYRNMISFMGGDIWFEAIGCGAVVDGSKVKGVVVATPLGRGAVLADVVIDATGNGEIAIPAGSDYMFTDDAHAAMQGTGLAPRNLNDNYSVPFWYANNDWTYVDETDVKDVFRTSVRGLDKYSSAYDISQFIQTRERRRIVGDYCLQVPDFLNLRTFPDTIAKAYGGKYDSHGFTVHPFQSIKTSEYNHCYIPYRSLIPANLDGILAAGLGISAHRDVIPVFRMQPDIQNIGYAAGAAAALASENGGHVRDIDVEQLQEMLVDKGIIESAVKNHQDSFPFTQSEISQAVQQMIASSDYEGLKKVLAQPEDAVPFLENVCYDTSKSFEQRLRSAHVLGFLGNSAGSALLVDAVENYSEWDEGWNFRSGGQFGSSLSRLDSYIIALGKTGDISGLQPVLDKAELLGETDAFSHFRAVAIALESIASPQAAEPLANLLNISGVRGHAVTNVEQALNNPLNRRNSLREIILARALYRCGDYNNLGLNTLKQYKSDLRGHYSRHAHAVLREADINNDDSVNLGDLSFLGDRWLTFCDMCYGADLNSDKIADIDDLTIIGSQWLEQM
ncbi:FAD-dependent oxidoreductase [Sedimentisphaera salicampi]|uniref:Tricarballylate dehydrogenase n=1 Tax=Sedimentisphaera salicampi TaxID=1941349 RepID=A0A1W6LJ12_9BACT|nr:FAD-dependent oxidoreductase [Sedimentisphaera salicampi]ARN55780.1 tricarballylate dehydrogenase [Sedimentisphaera salicampi]